MEKLGYCSSDIESLKNQELKQVIIEQTPWVFEAKTESQQRRNIAMLFETQKLSSELNKKLVET
jgi:hypothetical protein